MPAARISTPRSSARPMFTLSAARFPFSKTARQESMHLEEQACVRGKSPWNRAKKSARKTDSGELPAELARQHRLLWQGAVCALCATIHSLALSFQVAELRTLPLICGLSRPTGRRARVAPLGAGRSRARFGPTQDSRQNGSLACGVWHSPLPLSVPPVTGFGGAVPPSSGFGRFRLARVSGNAHKPLTSQEETHDG